jgi:predicted TPR repeat methyltransferase/thioredoxin-like negative regulator of GroEL
LVQLAQKELTMSILRPADAAFNPQRNAVLVRSAHEMIRGGRIHAARALLNALARTGTPQQDMAEIEATLLLREGRPAEALPVLSRAIAAAPDRAALYLCRADARMQINDAAGAASDAADAVVLDRSSHAAKAMLGVALIELGEHDDAAACLHEAVAQQPRDPAYRQGLATALERGGDGTQAAAVIAAGIALTPGSLGLHIAAIMMAMRRRDFGAAVVLAQAARRIGVADACVFGLLGHALSSLGQHDDALLAYTEALKLAPEDRYVRHLVTAGGIGTCSDRAPAEYLETVFDGYADRFEAHLITLGYRVPGLIRSEMLKLLPDAGAGPVLDLGCGTGLVAVALSDVDLGPWVGVDLSGQMLAEARDKGLYHDLIKSDLQSMLGTDGRSWQFILAADVFCYFGALETVLAQAADRLTAGGALIFSVEEIVDAAVSGPALNLDWRLGRLGRFAHSLNYIDRAVAQTGLAVRCIRREILRHEGGSPVPGLLVVLERTA